MRISDKEHKGLLKIGEATLDSTLGPSQLPPCCDALNAAAHSRIKEYTHTAMVQYDLLHTELAIQKIEMDDGSSILKSFSDKDVHRIIKRAGYFCKTFYDTGNESEWFRVDLETAKNAIRAFKEGRSDLSAGEKISTPDGKPRQISEEITSKIYEWSINCVSDKYILDYINEHYSSLNELPQIPEKQFNKLKHWHQSKIEMSKFLDEHKNDFWLFCKIKFWFRNFRRK